MIYTKSILKAPKDSDGIRISVMSRHTLSDGVTQDERIQPGKNYNRWLKNLAPTEKLVGSYYKRGLSWEEFSRQYIDFLKNAAVAKEVKDLARLGAVRDLTLLCIEDSAEKCHRRLLAEECLKYEPKIRIEHL